MSGFSRRTLITGVYGEKRWRAYRGRTDGGLIGGIDPTSIQKKPNPLSQMKTGPLCIEERLIAPVYQEECDVPSIHRKPIPHLYSGKAVPPVYTEELTTPGSRR